MTASDKRVEALLADAGPALLGYFVNRVEPREDAADLVSETVAVVWRRVGRVPEPEHEAHMWVFGVARNVLRNHERGMRRRDALAARLRIAITEAPVTDDESVEVRRLVESLPPDLAELVRLVYWDGFTLEDAARHLGIPASTARGRHQRAKAALRERLSAAATT